MRPKWRLAAFAPGALQAGTTSECVRFDTDTRRLPPPSVRDAPIQMVKHDHKPTPLASRSREANGASFNHERARSDSAHGLLEMSCS
jgi:hypothetical protein